MLAAPLLGVWVASSLAAIGNRATRLVVLAGLALFPLLPLAWEGLAAVRARRRAQRRLLTFFDRLILRTLAINVVFLGVLLGLYPTRAFIALSARGDWMLDGHRGAVAERARHAISACAGGLEWLYQLAHDNPYREPHPDAREPEPKAPSGTPAPPPTPAPAPGASEVPAPRAPEPEPASVEPPTPAPVTAQRYPWPATLHPVVESMPPEAEASIASVGKYIAERERDPVLRVKALHDWVADRVAYHAEALLEKRVTRADADASLVFRSRRGVCEGYARLLVALGTVTGDEIVYVPGDARSQDSPMIGEGHAWNAARIAGTWYLLDATWNAGSLKDRKFVKRYRTEYLFTPPAQFAVSHFPDQQRWQLIDPPLSRVEFFQSPVLGPAFFSHGLALRTPDRSQVSVARFLELELDNPHSAFVLATAALAGSEDERRCTGDRHTRFRCEFPAPGTYDVRLYVNSAEFGTYRFGGSVQANASP